MKTTRYIFATLSAVALTLTACHNDEEVTGRPGAEVHIVASINNTNTPTTQSADDGSGSFSPGDIYKLALFGGSGSHVSNYQVGTTTVYWEDVKEQVGTNATYTFGGWYTAQDLPAGLTSFNAATAADPDLLLATPVSVAENQTVNLAFRHAMHKLVVNVTFNGSFTSNPTDVTVTPKGMNASAAVNVQTGTVTPGEASEVDGTYASQTLTNNACSFILAPQKLTTGAPWLEINIPGESTTLTYNVPAQYTNPSGVSTALTQLNSGETLALHITVTKQADTGKIAVDLKTGQISAWTTMGSVTGSIQF